MAGTSAKKPFLGVTGGWLLFWITFACSVDMMMFGYDQAVFSGVIVTEDFLKLHNLVGPSKTAMLSTVTAIYDIGCFVGALLAFTVGERIGRKKSILIGTSIMLVGMILKASSYSLPQMFAGRIILGIGNGMNTATAPIWQCETSPAKYRGKLVMLEMLSNIAGFSAVNWINYGLSFHGGALAWRLPLALQAVFIICLFATVPWLPESPRWLMQHDRPEEAAVIIACLDAKDVDDAWVSSQCQEIKYSVDYEREHAIKWSELLRPSHPNGSTKPLRRLALGAGTQFMQQFEGINIMSYYLPTVLISAVGLSNEMARLLTAINSVTYLILSSASIPLVEKWGRRGLMLLSTAGQGLAFLVITILLRFANSDNTAVAKSSIPFFFLYYIAFGLGMLGVPWLYPTEINSIAMRTKGAAAATATNWITNYIIVQITPIGIQSLGWRFWIVFTVLNAAFLPVIYFFYPETANRTLEDIDDYYRHSPALIVTGDKDVTSSKRPLKNIEKEVEIVRRNSSFKADDLESLDEQRVSVSHVEK